MTLRTVADEEENIHPTADLRILMGFENGISEAEISQERKRLSK